MKFVNTIDKYSLTLLLQLLLLLFMVSAVAASLNEAASHSPEISDDQWNGGTVIGEKNSNLESNEVPDPCQLKINAMSVIREEYQIFSGKWFWRVNRKDGLVKNDPIEIHLMWYVLPTFVEHVDAVYERTPNGKILFFIDSFYWEVYDNRPGKTFKSHQPLTDFGFSGDVDHVDAAFVWPKNNRTYFVIGHHLWTLDSSGIAVEDDNPRILNSSLLGLKSQLSLDAAFTDLDGNVNFVQGDYFWTVKDLNETKLVSPKLRNESWIFGCSRSPHPPSSPASLSSAAATARNPLVIVLVLSILQILLRIFSERSDRDKYLIEIFL